MTNFRVRTEPSQPYDDGDVLLDWFNDEPGSTVRFEPDFFRGLSPSPIARDLFRLGGAVFCIDKIAPREATSDLWTRDLSVRVPVSDVLAWESNRMLLTEALSFLSGDRWDIAFLPMDVPADTSQDIADYDAVCLFSGGLDSLSGAIDLLEDGQRLVAVGHHDSSFTDHVQSDLFGRVRAHYGAQLSQRRLWLRPAPASATQARPLPETSEITTRGRSFLFISAGIAIASAYGDGLPLYMPENGFIGINVPLTAARAGSLSTRTTHPLFMHLMGRLLEGLGLNHQLVNPYRLLTKGEALEQNKNLDLLKELAPHSVSCSHPEQARFRRLDMGNCGSCYPCLIRRASLNHIGEDRTDEYRCDALTDSRLLNPRWKSGGSLRALTTSLGQAVRPADVLRNGRIPNGETREFFDMYVRGREELRSWLVAGAGADLRRRLV
jgi:7-cyano-7-deazaguanine synthase in queuosine biosynthesis